MTDQFTPQDPSEASGQPGPEQQAHPGSESQLETPADHGEQSYRGSGRLTGRRALVTGGDSGIGRAVALAFAREGADVAISHLPEEQDDADETLRLVREAGRTGLSFPGDLRDEEYCAGLVRQTVEQLGGLDVLVNNAAYQMTQSGIADITTEQFDRVLKTNLYAMFWLCKAAIPHLAPGSSIINTSSVQAYQPTPALLDYATTKAGIVNFTRGLAQELAPRGIRVNAVAPTWVRTPFIGKLMDDPDIMARIAGMTPLGRIAEPEEVAAAVLFFVARHRR